MENIYVYISYGKNRSLGYARYAHLIVNTENDNFIRVFIIHVVHILCDVQIELVKAIRQIQTISVTNYFYFITSWPGKAMLYYF